MPRPSLAAAALLALLSAPSARPADPVTDRFAAASAALERDRRSPERIADLAALAALEDDLLDLGRLGSVYERTAGDAGAHPEVRSLARYRLAGLERGRGNLLRSQAQLRRLGFVGGWTVIGPFDDEGKSGARPPTRRSRGSTSPAGTRARRARWPGARCRATARSTASWPWGPPCARRARWRPSPWRWWWRRATSGCGSGSARSGAAKVWVNGALALEDPTYHPARLDQRGAAVSLRKGPNRILVKLCHQAGPMGFYLRLADGSGEGRRFPRRRSGRAAARARPGARSGWWTRWRSSHGGLPRPAARARPQAQAPPSPPCWLPRASGDRGGAARRRRGGAGPPPWRPAGWRRGCTAAALEEDAPGADGCCWTAALRAAPGRPACCGRWPARSWTLGRPQEAARLLRAGGGRGARAGPSHGCSWPRPSTAPASPARAALAGRGDGGRASPPSPAAVRAAARVAGRLGRIDEAIRRGCGRCWRSASTTTRARASLASHLLERGDVDGRGGAARGGAAARPGRPGAAAAAGRPAGRQRPRRTTPRRPTPRRWALRPRRPTPGSGGAGPGSRAGRRARGLADLRPGARAPAAEPGAQGAGAEPGAGRASSSEAPYPLDAGALAAAGPAPLPDEDALVLGDLEVARVLPSGLSSLLQQSVVKVLTPRGADAARRQTLGWSPDRQEVQVERARDPQAGRPVVESHEESEQSTSEPWYRLYYDTQARTLTFPALSPGDVLEVAWRVDDTAGENLLSDYFGDLDLPRRALAQGAGSTTCCSSRRPGPSTPTSRAGVAHARAAAAGRRHGAPLVGARHAAAGRPSRACRAGPRSPASSTSPPTRPGTR